MLKFLIIILLVSWGLIVALVLIEEFVYTKLKESSKFRKWWRAHIIGDQEY